MRVKHVDCLLAPTDQAGLPGHSRTTQHALYGHWRAVHVYRSALKGGRFLLKVNRQHAPLVILPAPGEHQGVLTCTGEDHATAIGPSRLLLTFTLKELSQALLDLEERQYAPVLGARTLPYRHLFPSRSHFRACHDLIREYLSVAQQDLYLVGRLYELVEAGQVRNLST
jgi:hypothetical protein